MRRRWGGKEGCYTGRYSNILRSGVSDHSWRCFGGEKVIIVPKGMLNLAIYCLEITIWVGESGAMGS